jgi:hypothetical protein
VINLSKLTQSKANTLLQSVSQSTGIAEAQSMYGNKTFQESHAGTKAFAVGLSMVAQVVSAVLASSFIYFKIALPAIPFQVEYVSTGIAVLLTIIALFILEYLKRQILTSLSISYFKSKAKQVPFKLWLIPIAVVLTVISVYTSFEGAKIFVSQSDKSNLIADDYDTKLKNLESEERAFKNSISWKGKIDTYNKTNAKILAGFEDRKTALHQEKNSKIDVHKEDIEGKGFSTAIFSLLMEIIAIACMIYVCYVNFYVFIEIKTASPTDIDQENQVQRIGFSTIPQSTIAPNSQVQKVGFQIGTTLKVNNGEGNTVKVEKEYIQLQANERICKHCNSKFTFKHWNATYCSEKCKIEAWELRTGRKFTKKKGGAK